MADRSTETLSRGFRDGLRSELPRWRDEGLVSPDVAVALARRYRLAEAESGAPGLLAVYALGALLAGAGAISLVAWHWEDLPDAAKLALIGGSLAALHAGGAFLWRSGRAPRLGHALTLLGTLVFGAGVGLVAQIFHVSGTWWGGFAAFGAGALAAGLLYGSLPHLLLASVLLLGVAGPGVADAHPAAGIAGAWAGAVALVLVAVRRRSRALAVVTALGLGAALSGALLGNRAEEAAVLLPVALGALLAAAPLAAAPFAARGEGPARIAGALRTVGRLAFAAAAYALSFPDLARELRLDWPLPGVVTGALGPAVLLAAAALAAGLRRDEVEPLARGEALLLAGTALALGAGLSLETGRSAALVANLALGFLAAGRIVRGLAALRRGAFWEGMGLAGLLLLTRFVEGEAPLWLKGALFLAAGMAVIAAGAVFERRRARVEVA